MLPFDDFNDTSGPFGGNAPGQISSLDWFEVEASGPGDVNRVAFISGLATPNLALSPDLGDGTLEIDTGYQLDLGGNIDKTEHLIPEQIGPLVSVYVALGRIGGEDQVNAYLQSAEVHFDSDVLGMDHLKIRVEMNADGTVSITLITYQVVLLFHSTRPPDALLRAVVGP